MLRFCGAAAVRAACPSLAPIPQPKPTITIYGSIRLPVRKAVDRG